MHCKILTTTAIIFFLFSSLHADIIITVDNMILNGKIIEENKKTVKFGNYHGVFIIDRDKISEIYRTDSYEDDVKILSDKGETVNRDEVKTNYDSGMKKIDELETSPGDQKPSGGFSIALSPFIIFNSGELGNVLPCTYGFSLISLVPSKDFFHAEQNFLPDIAVGADYLYSEKDQRSLRGYRVSAGPLWKFSMLKGSFNIDWSISAVFGAGWYNIRGIYDEMNAFKWNTGISTGPVFTISGITFAPLLKYDYIYDSAAPLYGIGAALSLGYMF